MSKFKLRSSKGECHGPELTSDSGAALAHLFTHVVPQMVQVVMVLILPEATLHTRAKSNGCSHRASNLRGGNRPPW